MSNFKLTSKYRPTGDQPEAIKQLTDGISRGDKSQVLLGVTGSGKTFTVANVIANINRNILLADMEAYDKTLTAGGHLVLSGFLAEDVDILVEKAASLGYKLAKRRTNDIWRSLELIKN